tara:strand:- start:16 stop:219 length:204 start_codon:yes stop_codon:yes gene_type:complete
MRAIILTNYRANAINGVMQEKTHKIISHEKPKITKLGKAKELITFIPEVESKNSSASPDDFSVFTTT